ncbi:leucine-rich repeat protein soc-2-like isoform X1 [Daphnia carinata]|uniref:leucine-rich repeat protein soc-2-like isoform X1 n=1 Tax=Daphnia carinata TaxID=120202 RepID=UPI00257B9FB6|nr:leucine-rich repeat protein soc-2-like isoform X1 [Daphnia carinata]
MSDSKISKHKETCSVKVEEACVKPVTMSWRPSKSNCEEGTQELSRAHSGQWILKIDWSYKSLSSVPEFLPNYQLCTTLNLSGNNLNGAIDWLIHLKRLELLDLSRNKFSKIADACGSVSTLKHLDVSYNLLSKLPEWILLLQKVKKLNISCNPLEKSFHIHLKKAKWKSVEICNLENVNLVSIPDCLQSAYCLKELYLGNVNNKYFHKPMFYQNNALWRIPEWLPSSLSILDLSYVHLSNFGYDWKQLPNLKELRVRGNDLFWPSDDFTILTKLEMCDFSCCKMFLLPKDFGCLRNLCFINLSFNKLTVLPQSFEQFYSLYHLDLYHAGLETIECNLTQLPRLVECDLWMNLVDPLGCLPNHSDLCSCLRECLFPYEREIRLDERNSPSVASEDVERSSEEFDAEINDPSEVTASSTGTGVEESWDDEVFCDYEADIEPTWHVPQFSSGQKKSVNDDYFFLPSELHAASCKLPPNQFNIIHGQFDDIE